MTKKEAIIATLNGERVTHPERDDWRGYDEAAGFWRFGRRGTLYSESYIENWPNDDQYSIYKEPLKIEAGKWYRCRSGARFFAVGMARGLRQWVIQGETDSYFVCCSLNGQKSPGFGDHPGDLVEECEAPNDPSANG